MRMRTTLRAPWDCRDPQVPLGDVIVHLLPLIVGAAAVLLYAIEVLLLLQSNGGLGKALASVAGGVSVRLVRGKRNSFDNPSLPGLACLTGGAGRAVHPPGHRHVPRRLWPRPSRQESSPSRTAGRHPASNAPPRPMKVPSFHPHVGGDDPHPARGRACRQACAQWAAAGGGPASNRWAGHTAREGDP
jgi:hypothetical protein